LNKFLKKKEFPHEYLTYVDFVLFEALEIINAMKNEILEKYENFKEFHEIFGEQKFMRDYIRSDRYIRNFL